MKKKHETDPRDGWYFIDPEGATMILDSRPNNRPISKATAEKYAVAIRTNEWVENGQPIILDKDGKLLDGQHRLRAVQMTGKGITVYVIHLRSVTALRAFDHMDLGKRRTGGDRLAICGVSNYTMASALVTRWAIYQEHGFLGSGGQLHARYAGAHAVRRLYHKDREGFDHAVNVAVKYRKACKGLFVPAQLAFLFYGANRVNTGKARSFIHAIATGENIKKGDSSGALRSRMLTDATSQAKLMVKERHALLIRAWNHFNVGKTCTSLRWNTSSPYPQFEDIYRVGYGWVTPQGREA